MLRRTDFVVLAENRANSDARPCLCVAAARAVFDVNAPARQWQVHSTLELGPPTEADATLFHVGTLTNLAVPAYARADARVKVITTSRLCAVAAGANLFRSTHVEYASNVLVATRVPRSVNVQLVWSLK
jgi:hypothetical protein